MYSLISKRADVIITNILLVLVFTFLFVVSSYIRIPLFFSPVPITLQTFVLFLSLAVLRKKAAVSYVFYIALGVSGLSVFANGGCGMLYLFGPTGGYLFGFFLSLVIFGHIVEKVRHIKKLNVGDYSLVFLLANLLIYLCGIFWLFFTYKISLGDALKIGVVPFVIGDIVKIVLAASLSYKLIKC